MQAMSWVSSCSLFVGEWRRLPGEERTASVGGADGESGGGCGFRLGEGFSGGKEENWEKAWIDDD